MPRGDRRPNGEPVMRWMAREGLTTGPSRPRIKRYHVDEKFATTKKLAHRLREPIDNKGTTWTQHPGRYIDPSHTTRMHKPGSRKR